MSVARQFLDTNVAVYAYDAAEPAKQAVAQRLLRQGILEENSVISVQVLGEFFHAVTRRIRRPMTVAEASSAVNSIKALPVVDIDAQLVERAIETLRRYGISYWDALIVAAAERSGCRKLLSEDLNADQRYHGIVVVNPFATVADGARSVQAGPGCERPSTRSTCPENQKACSL